MKRFASAAVAALTIALAACSSTPKGNAPEASTAPATTTLPAKAEPAVAQAQIVRVPAAAAKKVVLNMTGPKTVTEAKDWASFKDEWRSTFGDHAKAKGITFVMQDATTKLAAEPGTLLNVYVSDYRQVGIGARIFLGVMTGNAFIDAKVAFADLSGGNAFGEQVYNTSSSAWGGVFSKMTPQQVDQIATEIFASISPR
jgi:uncharacterized lipoprotein YmbA